MPNPAEYPQLRKQTAELYELVETLDRMIQADAKKNIANGFPVYAASETLPALRKAETLLAKDHYKLCFAGGFSAGKSTAINAILEESDLLPTAAGECTLSITVMTGPLDGRELCRIKYFPRDIAIKNVVFHQKRYRNAFAQFEDKTKGAGPDQLLVVIRDVADWLPQVHAEERLPESLRKEFDKNKALKYVGELEEFLHYMESYKARCGNIHEDALDNVKGYLTYDDKQGGLGHLFMIEQVIIHKSNPLFEEKGIQIIDLPGIDSTNAYARQVTLDYLNEADLVINVLPPQGFTMSYIDIINEVSEANRGNIANKMFYIINRFDANEDRNFERKELESLLRDQIAAEIDKNGLNSSNLFATIALFDAYRLRGDQAGYQNLLAACAGKIEKMGPDVAEPWKTIATNALTGKGIDVVREAILKYLQEQLAFERLRDVRLNLGVVIEAADALLAKNSNLIESAQANQSTMIAQIREFVEKAIQNFDAQMSGLGNALPKMIGTVIGETLKPQITTFLERLRQIPLGQPDKQVAFTGQAAKMQNPAGIKQHWIDWAKEHFCDRFVDTVHTTLVGNVQGLISQQVEQAKIDQIMEHIGNASAKDLASPMRSAIATAHQNIDVITRLRATEETWPLRSQPIHPQGFEPTWTEQIENAFKDDIIANFSKLFAGYCDKLAVVLGQYYQRILTDLVVNTKARADEMEQAMRSVEGVRLPMELVTGEVDPDQERKTRLLAYHDAFTRARERDVKLVDSLT